MSGWADLRTNPGAIERLSVACTGGEDCFDDGHSVYSSHRGLGTRVLSAGRTIRSVLVVSVISLIVAAAGVAFGVYQWRRQRGHVRVQIDGVQSVLYLRVVVDAPTPVHVNGIGYRVKGRGHLRRLLRWLNKSSYSGPAPVRRRLAAMWRFRDMDLSMGNLERTAPWDWNHEAVERGEIQAGFLPIAGPEFPATIAGYDDASWKLDGANFTPMFAELEKDWPGKHLKVRFSVGVSGHPRRNVHTSWIRLTDLSIMFPENQHWIERHFGLPQVPRMTREEREVVKRRLEHLNRDSDQGEGSVVSAD
jgi:hypothetical protein